MGTSSIQSYAQAVALLRADPRFTIVDEPDGKTQVCDALEGIPLSTDEVIAIANQLKEMTAITSSLPKGVQRFGDSSALFGAATGATKSDADWNQTAVTALANSGTPDGKAAVKELTGGTIYVPPSKGNGVERLRQIFADISRKDGYQYFVYDPTAVFHKRPLIATEYRGDVVVGAIQSIDPESPIAKEIAQADQANSGYVIFAVSSKELGTPKVKRIDAVTSELSEGWAIDLVYENAGLTISLDTALNVAEATDTGSDFRTFAEILNNIAAVAPVPGAGSAALKLPALQPREGPGKSAPKKSVGTVRPAVSAFGSTNLALKNFLRLRDVEGLAKGAKLPARNGEEPELISLVKPVQPAAPSVPLAPFAAVVVPWAPGLTRKQGAPAGPKEAPRQLPIEIPDQNMVVLGSSPSTLKMKHSPGWNGAQKPDVFIAGEDIAPTEIILLKTPEGLKLLHNNPNTTVTVSDSAQGKDVTLKGEGKVEHLQPGSYQIAISKQATISGAAPKQLAKFDINVPGKPHVSGVTCSVNGARKILFSQKIWQIIIGGDPALAKEGTAVIKTARVDAATTEVFRNAGGVWQLLKVEGPMKTIFMHTLEAGKHVIQVAGGENVTLTIPPGNLKAVPMRDPVLKGGVKPAMDQPGKGVTIVRKAPPSDPFTFVPALPSLPEGISPSKAQTTWCHNIRMIYSKNFHKALFQTLTGSIPAQVNVSGIVDPQSGQIIRFFRGWPPEGLAGYPRVQLWVNTTSSKIEKISVSNGNPEHAIGFSAKTKLMMLKGLDRSKPMEVHLGLSLADL